MEFLAGLHPIVIHFPIAFLIFYLLLEIINSVWKNENLEYLTHLILSIGLVVLFVSVLTGNQAAEVAKHSFSQENGKIFNVQFPKEAISGHESYATITVWSVFFIFLFRTYYFINFVIRKRKSDHTRKYRITLALLALVIGYLIFMTGAAGGDLVRKYGTGTELVQKMKS